MRADRGGPYHLGGASGLVSANGFQVSTLLLALAQGEDKTGNGYFDLDKGDREAGRAFGTGLRHYSGRALRWGATERGCCIASSVLAITPSITCSSLAGLDEQQGCPRKRNSVLGGRRLVHTKGI